jgi:hypothetical protein
MLPNFRTKQKQNLSRNTQLKRVVRMLFFVMFVNVVLSVDALMLDDVFDSIIYFSFLVLFLLMKEK